jgi:formylglycine-generating enzyme required for sulfatase activity
MIVRVCLVAVLTITAATAACHSTSFETWTEPTTGIEFVRIPAGRFVMGSPLEEPQREAQEVQHPVTISRPFWMGKFEVTQLQWQTVMGANPSWFRESGAQVPVERVSYHDIAAFLDRLTARSTGHRFRLPSEAEWEYVCRAGTTTAFNTGRKLTRADANIRDAAMRDGATPSGATVRVGSFPPNPWGLHDLHGNVWEWTADDYCPYLAAEIIDPLARCGSSLKVIRGGSWYFEADSARCALRYTHRPADVGFSLGFRIVRDID